MEFRLLGPVEAVRDGRSLPLGGGKPRALLALLVLHANAVVSRDRLIAALWGDRAPGTAAHSLDVQISRLRKALEPDAVVLTRAPGYILEVDPERIDVRRFERLLEEGREANASRRAAEALEALTAALAVWRGPALADLTYEEFARSEVERLEELRLLATEERIDAGLALARHHTVIPELEALIAKHPHRERLRAQLMLALYRAGRQAEALRVYGDTRRQFVEQLGIEPSQTLRDLQQEILRQDQALLPPRTRAPGRGRRVTAGAAALVLAGAAAAGIVLATQGGTGSAQALASSDSNVFFAPQSGAIVRKAPVQHTVAMRFGAGSLWSASSEGELARIDPATGKILATIGLGIVKPGGIAFGLGSVWVTDAYSPMLLRIDPRVNDVVDRFPLPTKGVVTDLTGGVAVGSGSVWVGHGAFNPGAWVERLDPRTGRPQHRFPIGGGDANAVAYGDGAVWVGSQAADELRRIDPRTNAIVFTRPLRPNSHVASIAVGGGFAWAALSPEATVWKVRRDGSIVETITLPATAKRLTYAAGALWAAVGEHGQVLKIDPVTNAVRTYPVGHDVTDVDARGPLVAAAVQPSAEDVVASVHGDVVRVGLKSQTLFEIGNPTLPSTDPALYAPWDKNLLQFHYATCARLYNYPDVEGAAGKTVVSEVAAGLPTVADGGRTYTIALRDGFRFSPPSNAPVTAESFRDAIERDISHKFASDYLDPRWKALVGAVAYNSGKEARVSGLRADGDELVLRFTQPMPDLPRILALNVFCAVPPGTPIVPHGLETPIPSAGPYYLAAITDSVAVLKPNPNYGGSRPQRLDAIVFELGLAPEKAVERIASGSLDYVLEDDPALDAGTATAQAAGSRFRLTPDPTAHVSYFQFNVRRPLFSQRRMRLAVQYALNRDALAEADPAAPIPATRLLSPKVPGFIATPLYPLRGDLRRARALAGGRTRAMVVYTFDDPYTDAFNDALRRQLAAIGLRMRIRPMTNDDYANDLVAKKARSADLIWGGVNAETSDPASYLQQLSLPKAEWGEINLIGKRSAPRRDSQATGLSRRIERRSLFAVYGIGGIPELVSKRLGCIVHQPEYAGVDLAALCVRSADG